MQKLTLTDSNVFLTIEQRHIGAIAGFFGKHPRYDVNLGWLFVHISIVVSAFFFIMDLYGEAYDLPLKFRHMWDWIDGWIRLRL